MLASISPTLHLGLSAPPPFPENEKKIFFKFLYKKHSSIREQFGISLSREVSALPPKNAASIQNLINH